MGLFRVLLHVVVIPGESERVAMKPMLLSKMFFLCVLAAAVVVIAQPSVYGQTGATGTSLLALLGEKPETSLPFVGPSLARETALRVATVPGASFPRVAAVPTVRPAARDDSVVAERGGPIGILADHNRFRSYDFHLRRPARRYSAGRWRRSADLSLVYSPVFLGPRPRCRVPESRNFLPRLRIGLVSA